MKFGNKKDKRTNLEKEIDSVLEVLKTLKQEAADYSLTMKDLDPESKEYISANKRLDRVLNDYSTMTSSLEKLTNSQSKGKDNTIKWDTIIYVGGQLLSIVLIIGYEQVGVIATKALGFVVRGRG